MIKSESREYPKPIPGVLSDALSSSLSQCSSGIISSLTFRSRCRPFVFISEVLIPQLSHEDSTPLPRHTFKLSSCSAARWLPRLKACFTHQCLNNSPWQYTKRLWKGPCRGFGTKSWRVTHICGEHSHLIKRECVRAKLIPLSEGLPNTRGSLLSPSVVTDSAHPLNALSGALREQTG